MPQPHPSGRGHTVRWLGGALVLLQFGLLGAIGWRVWQALGPQALHPVVLIPLAAAIALGLWALRANRPGNFNIHPTPRAEGRLVTDGPYRWIRHPMYTALLLAAVAAALIPGEVADAGLWLALALVLWIKSLVEERALLARYPNYEDYRSRTARFIPGVF